MALVALHDLPAPAKLNLYLHLTGRRDDGYHLLESVFVLIDWCDTLHVERRDDGALRRHDLGTLLPPDDLCLRAARALQQASGCPWGADIHIDKQVPWGAGLGGGSSDAATVLLALNRLWALHWPRERLLALGETLGADVPFFLGGRPAFVEGIGERLTPIEWPATDYAVLKPPVELPTPVIFRHPQTRARLDEALDPAIVVGSPARGTTQGRHHGTPDGSPQRISQASPHGDRAGAASGITTEPWLHGLGPAGRNDLEPAAQALAPDVKAAAAWLEARFGNSRMTGSGSAVFARVDTGGSPLATHPTAPKTGSLLPADVPEGWVFRRCRSLPIHPLVGWAD